MKVNLASACALSIVLLSGASLFAQTAQKPIVTPYAQKGVLQIRNVTLSAPTGPQYAKLELTVDLSATYDNPFDPADVTLDARVQAPSGITFSVPGFLYRPCIREQKNGQEFINAAGAPSWRIRLAPMETGEHTVTVLLRDRSGQVRSAPVRFQATASAEPGFVRISSLDKRYFAFASGKSYFPIGANVCWSGRGTREYDQWFPRYGQEGCNYARLWLSPHWSTFALERPGKPQDGLGLGQIDLNNAWRIDYVLDLAASNGIRLMLCIDSYNVLREKDAYPQWDTTPHNVKQGGPLQRPTDFWNNAAMDEFYRNKLRYLVARYGYSPYVLSWEFWNEVDITTGYKSAPSRDWHAKMARTLRAMDPWRHLITTSFAGTAGDKAVDTLPEIDYVQSHHYNNPDLATTVAKTHAQKAPYGKPHLFGEIGADSGGPRTKDDPEGLQVHDPIWVSLATGCAGTAQPWWWDNLIHPRNLYPLFGGAVKFTQGIDWPSENFQHANARVEWHAKPNPVPRGDITIKGGPVSWNASEFNRPRRVQLSEGGAKGELPLAGIQHGLGGHRDKHNPMTFEMDFPVGTRFEVEVGDVSGYGGAALKITLDGNTVLTNHFVDPDGSKDTKTLTQYAGSYGVDVPAGKHTVVVENTGADWFMAHYRVRNAREQTGPPLLAWGITGKTKALAWVRLEERTWQRICAQKQTVPQAPPSVLAISGLQAGEWKAELWDTWPGSVLETKSVVASPEGIGRIVLPAIAKDLAVRMVKK